MRKSAKRFQDIQVLRAIACVMVIFQHVSLTPTLFAYLPGPPSMPFFLGVELFFVISGFVVTLSLFNRAISPAAFLTRRFFRLTPAILAFLIFSLIVLVMIAGVAAQDSAKNLNMTGPATFFSQSLAILSGVLINSSSPPLYYFGAMWSLSVEYQFYAVYAALAGILVVAGLRMQAIKDWLLAIFSMMLVASYATRLELLSWPVMGLPLPKVLEYVTFYGFDFLLLGAVLAFLTGRYGAPTLPRRQITITIGAAALALTLAVGMMDEPPVFDAKPTHFVFQLVAGLCLVLLVALAFFTDRYGAPALPHRQVAISVGLAALVLMLVVGLTGGPPHLRERTIHDHILLPVAGICFTLLVALASGKSSEATNSTRIYRALVWLGDRSYSMYLFHFPVMALIWWGYVVVAPWLFHVGGLWPTIMQSVFTFALTIMLADLTYRYIELPWNEVGERLSVKIAARSRSWVTTQNEAIPSIVKQPPATSAVQ